MNAPLGNVDAIKVREKIAEDCLDDLITWLREGGGQVGIYDGNNVTEAGRRLIHDKLLANDIRASFSFSSLFVWDAEMLTADIP